MAPIFLNVFRSPLKPLHEHGLGTAYHLTIVRCPAEKHPWKAHALSSKKAAKRRIPCQAGRATQYGWVHFLDNPVKARRDFSADTGERTSNRGKLTSAIVQCVARGAYSEPRESSQGTVGMPCSLHACSAGSSREMTKSAAARAAPGGQPSCASAARSRHSRSSQRSCCSPSEPGGPAWALQKLWTPCMQ